MSASRAIYMLPALVLSALAIILAVIGLSREPAAPPPAQTAATVPEQGSETSAAPAEELSHRYWALAHAVEPGRQLAEDDLMMIASPQPLAGAFPVEEDITGRTLRRAGRTGEVLASHHLEYGGALAATLQPGFRAMALPVDEVSGVGGLLAPGDLVDVLANFRDGGDQRGQPSAMVLMRNVELVAVGGLLQGQEPDPESRDRRGRSGTVVLAVPEASVPRLALAAANGSLRLTAVAARDISEVESGEDIEARIERVAVKPGEGLVHYRELFPAPPRRAPARPSGPQVEVIEGSQTRSINVRQ